MRVWIVGAVAMIVGCSIVDVKAQDPSTSSSGGDCRAYVEVVDPAGEAVSTEEMSMKWQSLRSQEREAVVSTSFSSWISLPCGSYRLLISAKNGKGRFAASIPQWSGDKAMRVNLTPGDFFDPPPDTQVSGVVRGLPSKAWVRLVPMFDNMTRPRDFVLLDDGPFVFRELNPGSYMVAVIVGSEVLWTGKITLFFGEKKDLNPIVVLTGEDR